MNVFFYLQLKPVYEVKFSFSYSEELKQKVSNLLLIEADNHSELYMISQSAEMMNKAHKIVCYIEADENEALGSLSKMLEAFRKSKISIQFLNKGQNKSIENAFRMLKANTVAVNSDLEVLKEATTFFSS